MKNLDENTRAAFGEWLNLINSYNTELAESLWEIEDDEIKEELQDYVDTIASAESALFAVLQKKGVNLPHLDWI